MNVGAQKQRGASSPHSSRGKPVSTPIVLLKRPPREEVGGGCRAPPQGWREKEIIDRNLPGTKIGKEGRSQGYSGK